MKDFTTADRLKQIMNERGLKQVDILEACKPFSEKYGVQLKKNDLSQYVSGKVEPKQDKLSLLGMALNVNEVWLMGYNVPPGRNEMEGNTHIKRRGVKINVLGRVAAGIPIEAIEDIVDTEEISEDLARTGEFFGLQIHGDSMEPRIYDGDVVIVRRQEDAESGEVVIAMVNGNDAVCKRLAKYSDGIGLISLNSAKYDPMIFSNAEVQSKPVKIIGKVIELRGKLCKL